MEPDMTHIPTRVLHLLADGPSAPHHASIRCRLARVDVQVDGTFRARSLATGEETVMIAVHATSVAGTITAPAGFFGTP
jgi:hypothetical protein